MSGVTPLVVTVQFSIYSWEVLIEIHGGWHGVSFAGEYLRKFSGPIIIANSSTTLQRLAHFPAFLNSEEEEEVEEVVEEVEEVEEDGSSTWQALTSNPSDSCNAIQVHTYSVDRDAEEEEVAGAATASF
eukprot:CAMPEP_0184491300 /NCGR_PEP_ID=MMETSP0113_2-20130426/20085_1 /TAXON_ID=91329 /ORGANISM="Norrisiella sphaerica, Strain BC52" /LENGTH=128 /DNA_ID=CAMNT_0026875607 /DNA_START=1125 /DNA_END=1508 /DNA_ORIENTATION=-